MYDAESGKFRFADILLDHDVDCVTPSFQGKPVFKEDVKEFGEAVEERVVLDQGLIVA